MARPAKSKPADTGGKIPSASVEVQAVRDSRSFVIRNSSFELSPAFRRDLHPDLRADYVFANPAITDEAPACPSLLAGRRATIRNYRIDRFERSTP
jgi:hypothetical protein